MCYFRYFLWVSNIKTSNGSQSMIYSENVVLYRILLNFVRGLLTVKFFHTSTSSQRQQIMLNNLSLNTVGLNTKSWWPRPINIASNFSIPSEGLFVTFHCHKLRIFPNCVLFSILRIYTHQVIIKNRKDF